MRFAGKLIACICILAGLQFLLIAFIFLFGKTDLAWHAVFGMALGLFVFWVIIGGLVMRKLREPIKNFVQNIPIHWALKFILFATALALLEEVITVAMTNTASFYGVTAAAAHITASANYWDVVLTHSVIFFVPMFCVWAWLLSKYDFSPNQVFLLFGLTGFVMEVIYGGLTHITEIGGWVLIYGLMVYLPAYSLPANRNAKKPEWWLYPAAIVGVLIAGVILGGILSTIIKHIRPPYYFPGVK